MHVNLFFHLSDPLMDKSVRVCLSYCDLNLSVFSSKYLFRSSMFHSNKSEGAFSGYNSFCVISSWQ